MQLSVAYGPESPLALDSVSFAVRPGQRLGVVGRTGAGKSTLMMSLFRLVEPRAGALLIDGVDIGTVHANLLRARISIIPQVRVGGRARAYQPVFT